MAGQLASVQAFHNSSANFSPFARTIGQGGAIPSIRSLYRLGSPTSRVGRIKHTVAQQFGGMRKVPLPILALVADSKGFRINNLNLQKGLESGFVLAGQTIDAREYPLAWAQLMIESRFSNVDLRDVAKARHQAIYHNLLLWRMNNGPYRMGEASADRAAADAELYRADGMRLAEEGDYPAAASSFLKGAWLLTGSAPEKQIINWDPIISILENIRPMDINLMGEKE